MKKKHFILISSLLVLCSLVIAIVYYKLSFKQKIIRLANSELKKWEGLSELSQNASQILIRYWRSVGRVFTPGQMQSANTHSNYPWSSAFISYLFYIVGAKDKFPYSAAHSTYFQFAKKNRNNKKAHIRGFRITEYAPKIGDIIVFSRVSGKGYDTKGHFPAHGELVVKVAKGFIKAIGGNVSNTVKESTYKTDSKGYLKGNRVSFFMVIQNNIR